MNDELLPYYEQELTFVRQMAAEFRDKYPAVAGRLLLQPNTCEDPHVERLIEAFAYLTGRIRRKLDDEFPEITEAFLEVLYPHYLRPIPSQAIVQFRLDPTLNDITVPVDVPTETALHSKPNDGHFCSFQTCYPVKLWPLRVSAASVSTINRFTSPGLTGDVAAVARIQLECLGGVKLAQLRLDSLRFYIDGESAVARSLYELLFLDTVRVAVRALPAASGVEVTLPQNCLQQVGFTSAEGVLPYSDRSFLGYRLLQEYFSFPEKFLFFDLKGLDRVSLSDFGSSFEILISLKAADDKHRLIALEQAVSASTFQLGCTPVVNLFKRTAEPVRISHTKSEYRIIADQHRQLSTEIYSVDSVASMTSYQEEPSTYAPFYSLRHGSDTVGRRFWYTHRRPSFLNNDAGTEVYLSLVDLDFAPRLPEVDMLNVRVTCTNRDYASRMRPTGEFGELEVEGTGLAHARCLGTPTRALRPPLRKGLQWRLISHLSLNHLSITSRDALQEILRLYDFTEDLAIHKQIAGIIKVSSKPSVSRVLSSTGVTFCRGTDVTVEFDENQYAGTGVFLLASVLDRFFGLYAALNSFSRLDVRTSKGAMKRWLPRAGEQILL